MFSKKATKIDEIFTLNLTLCSKCQIGGEYFVNFCGLLRKYELYINWVKMFLKPVWEGKMHGVTKNGAFRPLFCVRMLGKSTNYSTGTRPLCSTF